MPKTNQYLLGTTVRTLNLRNVQRMDWFMAFFMFALAAVGWSVMYSASTSASASYFSRHVVIFFAGLLATMAMACIDYRTLVAYAPLFYLCAVALLAGTLAVGDVAKGGQRWLNLGFVRFQPSELSKLATILALAWYLSLLGERIRRLHWFLIAFAIAGVPMALILKQPNLGTAASLGPMTIVMLYAAGCRFRHLLAIILIGLSGVPVLWLEMKDFDPTAPTQEIAAEAGQESAESGSGLGLLRPHQKKRIYSFLYPESDLQGSGWHTYQSKITVGSGGLFGKGYLQGTQTRLNYLPEFHTDFIYSLLAEEFGFVGAVAVLGLFAAFLLRGLMFARDCTDMAGTLLATGIVTILAFHVFVNIAITVGVLPVTGIPLPFLSYGRTFYLTTMACVGVLMNIHLRRGILPD